MVQLLINVACLVGILFLLTIGVGIATALVQTVIGIFKPLFTKHEEIEDEEE